MIRGWARQRGYRIDTNRFQNMGFGRITDRVADIGKLTLNPIAAQSGIMPGESKSQIVDHLADA